MAYAPRASSPFTVETPEPRVTRPGRTPVRHFRDGSWRDAELLATAFAEPDSIEAAAVQRNSERLKGA